MQESHLKDRPRAWSSIRSMFRRKPSVPGALTVDDLARAFQQERARTDRNDRPFCMVIFWDESNLNYDLRPLAAHLRSKMRLYDLLGHLDAEHLAVLLPETRPAGAEQFAKKVLAEFQESNSKPGRKIDHEICTYPLDGPHIDAQDQDPSELEPTSVFDRGSRAEGLETPDVTLRSEEGAPGQAQAQAQAQSASPAKDLAQAFLQPVSPFRRTVDILVSGTAILLLAPVYVVAALAVKLTTPGDIIFTQLRAGRGGVPFKFYKFRSMYVDAEARRAALQDQNEHNQGPIFKMKGDPRITRVGKILRKTSIDELPQLFNVLKGDMTLIGPRPPTLDEVANYDLWQRKRLDLTGGITCIWQVSGRSEINFNEWVRMDIDYQRRKSFWFDVKLLFKTIGAVVTGRGAY